MQTTRIERIHHLTIAVPSLERALDLWRHALGVSLWPLTAVFDPQLAKTGWQQGVKPPSHLTGLDG